MGTRNEILRTMAGAYKKATRKEKGRMLDHVVEVTGHNRAFEFLGGVPFFVRLDNLKTGVASGCGAWAKINDGYEILARSRWNSRRTRTGSTPRGTRARPRGASTTSRSSPVTDTDRFEDTDHLQETGTIRVVDRSKKLTCPVTGKSVYESWHLEKPYLKPLPLSLPEPFDVQVSREVSRDCRFRLRRGAAS